MNIPFSKPVFYGDEVARVVDSLHSTWISDGKYVNSLEGWLEMIFKSHFAITTSNGTSALMLSFLALGLKPGDEIIVPGFCFQAAANTALILGLVPRFVDVEEDTWNISIDRILENIGSKTKAIVVVHTYGNVVDVSELRSRTSVPVIEDCAESIFSKIDGKYCGTLGNIGTFSFHATKTITTGEGGALVTNSIDIQNQAKLYRSHGLVERGNYSHEVPGNNFRLTNMQAALGVAQIQNYNKIVGLKKNIFDKYNNLFMNRQGITIQCYKHRVEPVIWSYGIRIDEKQFALSRDEIIRYLKTEGVETRPGFVSANKINYFNMKGLPISSKLSDSIIVLPAYTTLIDDELEYIANAIFKLRR